MARRSGLAAVILAMSAVLMSAGGDPKPTAADVDTFLDTVNTRILELGRESAQVGWVYSTYITEDTEALNARASRRITGTGPACVAPRAPEHYGAGYFLTT